MAVVRFDFRKKNTHTHTDNTIVLRSKSIILYYRGEQIFSLGAL